MITTRIGIDPGKKTGLAVYCLAHKRLTMVKTLGIVQAMATVQSLHKELGASMEVWIEDARKRTWYGNPKRNERNKLQGVGSIKRDCAIWEEFCLESGIKFSLIHPKNISTKLNKSLFMQATRWGGRTSEHARDAAMIVHGTL